MPPMTPEEEIAAARIAREIADEKARTHSAKTAVLPAEIKELKPCPFCGSKKIEKDAWSSLSAEGPGCEDCGATAESAEAWNRRAQLEARPAVEDATQTDLAKRLIAMAEETGGRFAAISVLKADLIAICCEANRYYMGMMNWKRTAETKDRAPPSPAVEAVSELTDEKIDQLMKLGLPNTQPSAGFRKFARAVESYVRAALSRTATPAEPKRELAPIDESKPCREDIIASGAQAIPRSCPRCGIRKCPRATPAAEGVSVPAKTGTVGEWISVDDRLPSSELLPNGRAPVVLVQWREGELSDNLSQIDVCNTVSLWANVYRYSHWMPIPPAPIRATPATKKE